MKALLATITGLCLAASIYSAPVEAKRRPKKVKKITREATVHYDTPGLGVAGLLVWTPNCGVPNNGCAYFQSSTREAYVDIEIIDDSGKDATGAIIVDGGEDIVFCGSTPEPVAIEPGSRVHVTVHVGPGHGGPADCIGVATSGTVKATFSNIP